LSVPLYAAPDEDDVVAEWQLWGRVLQLPLLVADPDGTLRAPFTQMGTLRIAAPTPRRRRRYAIKTRRPSIPMRREPKRLAGHTAIHRNDREIIART
jgi:hypothetical protein